MTALRVRVGFFGEVCHLKDCKNPAMSAGQNGQQIMDESIKKALETDLTDEQVKELESKLTDEGKVQLREVIAIKKQRKAEEERLAKAKAENEEVERKKREAEEKRKADELANADTQTKFRAEQISVAKQKFFSDYKIPPEEQAKYEAEFRDSGKMTPDLIYKDWEKAFAAVNSDTLIKTQREREEMERKAQEDAAKGAGGNDSPPGGGNPPSKFSKEAEELAKSAGITPEAAERQVKEGMTRVIA